MRALHHRDKTIRKKSYRIQNNMLNNFNYHQKSIVSDVSLCFSVSSATHTVLYEFFNYTECFVTSPEVRNTSYFLLLLHS